MSSPRGLRHRLTCAVGSTAAVAVNAAVMLTKKLWERIQKIAILKELQTHFKAKREKGVGTPFPRVPAPLQPWLQRYRAETARSTAPLSFATVN